MNIQELASDQQPSRDSIRDTHHYYQLFKRTKWYLLFSGLFVLTLSLITVLYIMQPRNPELPVSTLIGLDQHTWFTLNNENALSNNLGREDIMMSRTFLRDVAQKISLRMWTVPLNRNDLFDSVHIESSAPGGTYYVHFSTLKPGNFNITYYDTNALELPLAGFIPFINRPKILFRGCVCHGTTVKLPGISFTFSNQIMKVPRDFSFQIVDIRIAVEAVYRNLTIRRASPDEGINYIAVVLNGRDYELATLTVNAIADLFIEKNFRFRQQHTHNIVESLEKQLHMSERNLSTAESKMRDFRLKNPQVGLDQRIQQTIDTLDQLNSDIQHISNDIVTAENLKKAFMKADTLQRLPIAEEMAQFLTARMAPSGRSLQDGLERLIAQKYALLATYGTENPKVLENSRLTTNMTMLTLAAINDFIKDAHSSGSRKKDSIVYLSNNLLELPVLEMQLGELERNRQIYADIYSAVLADYNKSKVLETVEKSVFYIMDYAVAPLPPPVSPVPLVTICILIAVLLSFGPVLVYDQFDKTVHTQQQLARVTGNAPLETIPVFTTKTGKGVRRKLSGGYPLISMPCKPIFTKEIFNTLHLKITLLMNGSVEHGIVVSSFESRCGKSIISANLAMAIAMHGHRTLLVDADLRRGMIRKIFNLADSEGLSELLARSNPLSDEDCLHSIVTTQIPDLYILPSGHESSNPGALLSSPRMLEFRKFCDNHGSFLVMDSPPISAVGDAVALHKLFTHYIFVVRAGKTNVTQLIDRIGEFGDLRKKILGYVLNVAPYSEVGNYQHYFRSGIKDFFVNMSTKK